MSFVQDKIYPYMPLVVQNAMISAFGYNWQKRRYGGIFEEELKKFKERESFNYQQWHDYQVSELRRLLEHAFETVPYYNTLFKKVGYKTFLIPNSIDIKLYPFRLRENPRPKLLLVKGFS